MALVGLDYELIVQILFGWDRTKEVTNQDAVLATTDASPYHLTIVQLRICKGKE